MTTLELREVMGRMAALWPGEMTPATAKAYGERFERTTRERALAVLERLADEGAERRPVPGRIAKQLREMFGGGEAPASQQCTCHITGLPECPARHDDGWRQRQMVRDQAVRIVENSQRQGYDVDPGAYPGELGSAVASYLLGNAQRNVYAECEVAWSVAWAVEMKGASLEGFAVTEAHRPLVTEYRRRIARRHLTGDARLVSAPLPSGA